MTHLTLSQLANKKSIPASIDTLVVGAGMSGLYATWRILQKDPKASILIFERSQRTGGRLDSDLITFADGETVKEEEGGMRFTFEAMDNLMSLFLLLDLDKEIVPFPMSSGGTNRLYFRGHSFDNTISAEDNYAIWDQLYNLAPSERGINPSSIIDTVFNRILSVNPNFKERPKVRTPEFWQKFRLECQWNGVLLKDWTLWNLFTEMGYSTECITMLYGLAGFNGTFLSQMNAGEAYQLLEDFPADPDFKTLENGFSTLPNALVKEIKADKIFLRTQLESIDKKTDKGYELTYSTIDKSGKKQFSTIIAKKVILCMPRLALEKLFMKSDTLNKLPEGKAEKLWDTLQTTTNQALLKINLYYDKAWWGNDLTGQAPVGFGPNFSDLPTGSVYPFYAIDEEAFAALEYEKWLQNNNKPIPEKLQNKLKDINNKKYGLPAALTIYCDYLNINFWKALQENGAKFNSPMQQEYSGQHPQTIFPASEAVVEAATSFFKKLFNTNYVPRPVMTSARIWQGSTQFNVPESEQFDFGVHQWGLHANDKEVIPYLTEPLEGIYTCGEAYSDYQGWVEGALRSTNLVLKKAFGLAPINEVYKKDNGISPSDAIAAKYAKNAAALIRKYIDPSFKGDKEKELAEAQGSKKEISYGISLSYFDTKK
jgi:hypothetical protein